jgi:lipopolysaccharide biosynthesis protein
LGHRQPRIPEGQNLYSLEDPRVLRGQAAIAQSHCIDVFSYYFYNFSEKAILTETIDQHVYDPEIQMPFCLTWANENWTKHWDGSDYSVILEDTYDDDYVERLFSRLERYFRSEKYLRTSEGELVFLVYRADKLPNPIEFSTRFRAKVSEVLGEKLHLLVVQSFRFFWDPALFGFDGSVEFPPHAFPEDSAKQIRQQVSYFNLGRQPIDISSDFEGQVFDYSAFASLFASSDDSPSVYRTAMLEWDNTARNPVSGTVFSNFDYGTFEAWMVRNLIRAQIARSDDGLVFVNAWNEWAEGTVLEPREDDGKRALSSVSSAVSTASDVLLSLNNLKLFSSGARNSDAVCVFHCHTVDRLPIFVDGLRAVRESGLDMVATATSARTAESLRALGIFDDVFFTENRGRDILPFLGLLPVLEERGYKVVLKIHSKISPQLGAGGKAWGRSLVDGYCDPSTLEFALKAFADNEKLGFLISGGQLTDSRESNSWVQNLSQLQMVFEKVGIAGPALEDFVFAAGSFFWARISAISPLIAIPDSWFELETPEPFHDGRIEHSIERAFLACARSLGYEVAIFPDVFGSYTR